MEKKFKKTNKKISNFLATHECPQNFQPIRSSRLAGYREHIYECLVLNIFSGLTRERILAAREKEEQRNSLIIPDHVFKNIPY